MNECLAKTRNFLKENNLDYLIVTSTNEFLVEYNELSKNSRFHLTGFSGSTGDALISEKEVFLFVDGRYHIQADLEVNHKVTTVVKLQMGEKVLDKMFNRMENDTILGICSKKLSQYKYENLCNKLKEKNIKVVLFDFDIAAKETSDTTQNLTKIPLNLTGKSSDEKINELTKNLEDDEAILVTCPEDLSYLYNLRNFEKENSCSIEGKALVSKEETILFINETLKNFDAYIQNKQNLKTIYVDKHSITAYDYALLQDKAKNLELNPIQYTKCIKTEAEINHYKEAFKKTDLALLETRKFIEETENISEYDIKLELEKNFKKYGAICQSFNSIIAKDANSSLAHYSKSSKDEILKNGSLVLIDCGAFYEGGLATDITRVFVKGTPTELQRTVYTTVLKAFLKAFNTKNCACGLKIDKVAREFLENNSPEGFVFNHGLGHGIGVSVHEAPPRLSTSCEASIYPLENNMCFTIEPGLYKNDVFGVRLENSCYFKNEKIHSFTNMCYEKKLIDFSILTEEEKVWLSKFEVR